MWFGIDKHFKYSIWNRPYTRPTLIQSKIGSIWSWMSAHSKDKLHGIFNRQKGIYNQRMRSLIVLMYRFVCNTIQYGSDRAVSSLLSTIEALASFRIKLPISFFLLFSEVKLNATIQSINAFHFINECKNMWALAQCVCRREERTCLTAVWIEKKTWMKNDKSKATKFSGGKL